MRLENQVMRYDHRLRPAQPVAPAEGFAIHRSVVRDGVAMAYVHEGVGGYPLLLVHGYPETKRIWWRNIEALAAGGYEVIVPDLRGYGDSDLSPGDEYDLAVYSRDLYALVHDVLGHEHCGVVGGDVGGAVLVDMIHRFPDFVDKLCFFNTVPPMIIDEYRQAGIMPDQIPAISMGQTGDYRYRQGATPDELASELDTPDKRRRYVADMYGHRLWASPGAFDAESIEFMTEPFAEIERLRAGWAVYQLAYDARGERTRVDEPPCRCPDIGLVRPGRPCGRSDVRALLRSCVRQSHRPRCGPRGGSFPAMGARRHPQSAARALLRRPSQRMVRLTYACSADGGRLAMSGTEFDVRGTTRIDCRRYRVDCAARRAGIAR